MSDEIKVVFQEPTIKVRQVEPGTINVKQSSPDSVGVKFLSVPSIKVKQITPDAIDVKIKHLTVIEGGSDKNYEQSFLTSSSVLVTHNLDKRPSVTVIDSADTEIICDVIYEDNNNLTVVFSSSFSGVVICN